MISEHTKHRIAITIALIGGAAWVIEMISFGMVVWSIKVALWP